MPRERQEGGPPFQEEVHETLTTIFAPHICTHLFRKHPGFWRLTLSVDIMAGAHLSHWAPDGTGGGTPTESHVPTLLEAPLPVTTGYVCVPDTLLPSSGLVDADRLDLTSSSPGVRAGREYSFPWEEREKRQLSIDAHTWRKGSVRRWGGGPRSPPRWGRRRWPGRGRGEWEGRAPQLTGEFCVGGGRPDL